MAYRPAARMTKVLFPPLRSSQLGFLRPALQRGALAVPVLAAGLFLSGCADTSNSRSSFAFASSSGLQKEVPNSRNQAQFADGKITLAAPSGHCFDPEILRQEADGGFALLPRCNLMQGSSWFGKHRAAVITATIGEAKGDAAPGSGDLARTAAGAKLLHYDDSGLLPLVRLHWPSHGATGSSFAQGASPEHWRGAFVLDGSLVVLALYAPEGSPLLGEAGAEVLREMTRRSLEASLQSAPEPTLEGTPSHAASQIQQPEALLRPRPRPGKDAVSAHPETKPRKKLSLRQRIAGLFQ